MKKPLFTLSLSLSLVAGLVILFSFPAFADAATYYVRADGTVTCANKTNATSPELASTSLGVLSSANGVNGCTTFQPGDTLYFSAKGGSYTSVDGAFDSLPTAIYIPQASGTIGNPINYIGLNDNSTTTTLNSGATNNYPIVDVSAVATGSGGMRVSYVNYVTVQNFNLKGSGGGATSVFSMAQGSGTAGSGFTNVFTNINVLSNYGASSGNNDCMGGGSATGENAQGIFNNITANGCRPNPQAAGSHQCFTLHEDAKAQINGFYCTDSNNGITDTLNTQLTATNVTMSNLYTSLVSAGTNMASTGYINLTNSVFNVNGTGYLAGIPNGAGSTNITIQNSTINVTSGTSGYVYGGTLNLIGNIWTINSSAFKEYSELGGTINVIGGNIFNIQSSADGIFISDTGTPSPVLNISGSQFNGAGGHIIKVSGTGIGNVHGNIFNEHNGTKVAGWVLVGSGSGALNWYNNTHYNSSKTGTALYIQSGGNINNKNNVYYNIDTPCNGGNCAATGYVSSYGDYYNYTTANNQGTGSLTLDPLFVNATTSFQLLSTSPALDAGTGVGLSTDYAGNSIYGTPDIGAYEYQPPFTFTTNQIPTTGSARLYSDGKYRMTTASTTNTLADFAVTPISGYLATTTQLLDITLNTWDTTGDKNKSWTATSTAGDFQTLATSTTYTIGDLVQNVHYIFQLDGLASTTAISDNSQCSNGACLSDDTGHISFTYVGGYSTHTFELIKDISSPLVEVTSPLAGATIAGTINFTASSSDDISLSSLQFNLDGVNYGATSSLSSYTLNWDSTTVTDGSHSLLVVARDTTGNYATSSAITFTVHNAVSHSSGSSVANQIQNLLAMGNTQLANELKAKYLTPDLATTTSSSTKFTFTRDLKLGTKHPEVKLLQQFLNTHGFLVDTKGQGSPGQETTLFGNLTKQALIKFQKANKIKPASGYFGPITRKVVGKF